MRSYWNLALAISISVHLAVLVAVPALAPDALKRAHKKEQTQEMEIIAKPSEPISLPEPEQYAKPPTGGKTPPPYVKNLVKKTMLKRDSKISLDKPPLLDDSLKDLVFSNLPQEQELKKNPAYMDYYRHIREKIRAKAFRYYDSDDTGKILLTFILQRSGQLEALYLDNSSTSSRTLIDIALRSIKNAAPFPPFPPELNYPRLQFNISILFEKK